MKSSKTRFFGVLILLALLYLSGFGEWLKAAFHNDPLQTWQTTAAWAKPFIRQLAMALSIGILAVLGYGRIHKKWVAWTTKHFHVRRVQEIAQSAFPVFYWILTALAIIYTLDHTLSWITAGTLLGTGVILKPELDNAWACCVIQSCVKVKIGEWVQLVDKDGLVGQVTEINLIFARILTVDGKEIRINTSDLRSIVIIVLPGKPEAVPAPAKS